jgi:(p)ppGpp synthase/HD superfamily hydrolase
MEDYQWERKFEPCWYSNRLLEFLYAMNKKAFKKVDILEIKKAIYYAKKYHGNQKRLSGEPYYSHPLEVAYMLAEHSIQEDKQYYRTDLLISSILHDTIEDTLLTKEMIAKVFGGVIASQVENLTRIKINRKITSEELVYSLILQKNKDLLIIKLFDRLHNVQTIEAKSPEKIKKIIDETIRVFLLLSTYLEMPQIKNSLLKFCYKYSQIKPTVYSLANIQSTFSTDNFQLPSPKIQNDVVLKNILK